MTKFEAFIFDCCNKIAQMRSDGVPLDDVLRGLHRTVIDGARESGLISADRDLPHWFLKRCSACQDTGWERCTRMVRGEVVEAYRRCTCQAQGMQERQDDQTVASKAASGWKQVGRR